MTEGTRRPGTGLFSNLLEGFLNGGWETFGASYANS